MANSKTERKLPHGLTALKMIVEGTSQHTGESFFQSLVKNLAQYLDAYGVWVAEYLKEPHRLRAIAFWMDDHFVDEYEYNVPGTPCEPAIKSEGLFHVSDNIIELFPEDYNDLKKFGAVSYLGFPLKDDDGSLLGHLALLDQKPMEEIPEAFAIFKIFAIRAEAELKRLKKEKLLRESEAKLNRLVNGTMDGLLEINENLTITQVNQSVLNTFGAKSSYFIHKPIKELLNEEDFNKLNQCVLHLSSQNEHFLSTFIQGAIHFQRSNGKSFPAEATISKYRYDQRDYYALFIRNIEDRLKNQQELKMLNVETTLLREKVSAMGFDNIVGESPALRKAIQLVNQVAPMNSTVLIRGETGTGKELIARAIHQASHRRDKPMITLNCAALPSELVESELFGHVKGAFTGASNSREGRFSLAHNGTIFLDEIGELPLTLQAKILRVLQEGEFEQVGSSVTQKVDVRVITATNRDLENEVKKGIFREDLFYRLNVFPIDVPPLRERGSDIIILAEAFIEKFSKRSALKLLPLDEIQKQRLLSYHWPGNVRELQNVIERAIITHSNGKINLSMLNPVSSAQTINQNSEERILSEAEILDLEKRNIIKALEACHWKISGEDGAAALLQIPPTTLSSRMSKLKIKKQQV